MFQCFYSRTKTILRVDYNLLKRWLCNDVGVTRQSSWPQFPLTLILIFLQVRLKRKTRCTKDVRNALDCKYSKHPTPDPGFCTQQQNKLLQHKNITLPWFQTIRNLPFHYIHSFQKVEVKKDFFHKMSTSLKKLHSLSNSLLVQMIHFHSSSIYQNKLTEGMKNVLPATNSIRQQGSTNSPKNVWDCLPESTHCSYFLKFSSLGGIKKNVFFPFRIWYQTEVPPRSMWKSVQQPFTLIKQYFCTLGYIISSRLFVASICISFKCLGQTLSIQSIWRTTRGAVT